MRDYWIRKRFGDQVVNFSVVNTTLTGDVPEYVVSFDVEDEFDFGYAHEGNAYKMTKFALTCLSAIENKANKCGATLVVTLWQESSTDYWFKKRLRLFTKRAGWSPIFHEDSESRAFEFVGRSL